MLIKYFEKYASKLQNREMYKRVNDKKNLEAYITVLIGRDYLDGVKVLKRSLDKTKPKHPFYVLLPDNISKDIADELENEKINILYTSPLGNEVMGRDNKVDYWKNTLFKLKIFDLTSFEKIVFLDSDMIVFKNLDDLFSLPHMSAVAAGSELHKDWVRLNSGLMVVEPSHDEYLKLLNIIEQVFIERQKQGLGVGDQDIINAYYHEWAMKKELHLSSVYNTMLGYAGYLKNEGRINNFSEICVYHFTGKEKPWRNKFKEDLIILFKIFKRSKSKLDFMAFKQYKEVLLELKR